MSEADTKSWRGSALDTAREQVLFKEQVAGLEAQCSRHKNELAALHEQVGELQQQCETGKKAIATRDEQVAELDTKYDRCVMRVDRRDAGCRARGRAQPCTARSPEPQ